MHANLHLLLRWDTVEATAACVALYIYNAEAVASILAYALECSKESLVVDASLHCFCLVAEVVFLLACLVDDFVELCLFLIVEVLEVSELSLGLLDVVLFVFDRA